MKNSLKFLVIFLSLAFFISCSTEESDPKPIIDPTVEDTYNYIALRNDGQLFEIGNFSGKVTPGAQIPEIEFNVLLNGIASTTEKIYIYEHEFDPFQGYIHVYDKATGESTVHALELSTEIFGEFPGLVSLDWDQDNKVLIAIVKENYESNFPLTGRVAAIDPQSFEVSSLEIAVERAHILSTVLKDNSIFATSYGSGTASESNHFFEIDLSTGKVTDFDFPGMVEPPVHLAKNQFTDNLFGFLPVPNSTFAGETEPVLINYVSNEVIPLLPNNVTGSKNMFGNSFFNPHTREYVDVITSATYNGLFQYEINTGKVKVTQIQLPNDLSSLFAIIGVQRL